MVGYLEVDSRPDPGGARSGADDSQYREEKGWDLLLVGD
jgi:hypothetical protein